MNKTLLIDQSFILQKKEGKGGWTFVIIKGIPKNKKDKLGQVRVCGQIDGVEIKQFNLLPLIGGDMMLPIKSAIRKKIGKKAGSSVQIILFSDNSPVEVPDEIEDCLLDSPQAHQFFYSLSDSNQKYYLDWIDESKRLETKIGRIGKMIERLEKGLRFYDW